VNGWIKLHRSILNWEWYDNPNVLSLFIHCLFSANYEEKKWHGQTIKKGSFITSIKHLSEDTGLSTQQVRTALSKLQTTNNITIKTTNKYSLITIIKWEKYQENKQDITNKQQTNNKQITTTKEYKNIKESNISNKRMKKPTLEELENYCLEKRLKVDCNKFIDYYNSNGWKVGKNNMKDWKATLRNWDRRNDKKEIVPDWLDKEIKKEEVEVVGSWG